MTGLRRWLRSLTAAMLLLSLSATGLAGPGPRTAQVRARVTIHNPTDQPVTDLVLTLPPAAARTSGQRPRGVPQRTLPPGVRVRSTAGGTTYVVARVEPGETVVIEEELPVEFGAALGTAPVAETEPSGVAGAGASGVAGPGRARYLAPEPGVESEHPAIRAAAHSAVAGAQDVDARAEALLRAVVAKLDYDWSASGAGDGALKGLEQGFGTCLTYASLFVAMARAAGLPARLVYGWADSRGLEGPLGPGNRHVWAEYFHPERGWVPVDPTFAEQQEELRYFDPSAHLAQAYEDLSHSASFSGRGLVSIRVEREVTLR